MIAIRRLQHHMHYMQLSPTECYELAVAAAHGERVPMTDGASKMLCLLLTSDSDCEVTPERFAVQLDVAAPHGYASWTVPGLVSWIVERIGSITPSSVTGVLAPASVAYPTHGITWSFAGERHVRIESRPGSVWIRVRATAAGLSDELPPPRVAQTLTGRLTCPHCHVVATSYRELSDRSLVCLACGRSAPPAT